MNQISKTLILLFLFLVGFTINSVAQEKRSINFVGIIPSVTVEPFYNKGELDIDVFPLVYQKTLTSRVDYRIISIVNYGIRNTNSAFSHVGLQVALPLFLTAKENKQLASKGFFLAPGFGATRNLIEKHNNFGLWVEPGYHLLFDDNFAISFGVQFGATHFWYDNGTTKWGNHFGVKVIFGKWF